MGAIDLDPASNAKANEIVKAFQYYTKEDDGLSKDWFGNVWLNPPYSRNLILPFAEKVVEEIESDAVKQILVLVNNSTETKAFQYLANNCDGMCLVKGRIKFLDSDNNPSNKPLQGQAIFYFGDNYDRFDPHFSSLGVVVHW